MTLMNNLSQVVLSTELIFCGVAVCVPLIGAGLLLRRRRRAAGLLLAPKEIDFEAADAWLPPTHLLDERRGSVRREDSLVEVKVVDPKKPKKVMEGYVVNRSVHGVRLAIKGQFSRGSILEIKAAHAPDDTPATRVTVRHCDELGDYYRVGCQFNEKVPWNILLMFG